MMLLGVDVGGTFTDVVVTDTETGRTAIHKVPTTPDDPSLGVIRGMLEICASAGIEPASVRHVLHGTTTATNAVLEYDGAVTGMVTTEGYRDIVHIGRHQRPQHFSIMQEIPWQDRPLVRRRHRLTVKERLTPPDGSVEVALDEAAVRDAAEQLKGLGVEAITVCFLFSYLNPLHERRAKEIIAEAYPDCFVSTSAEISPQFREFERFTTAAMNAFIGPKVRRYVQALTRAIQAEGFDAELHIMSSNGGVATVETVSERPVITLLSGPAAGVLGAKVCGQASDRQDLISFDVGGTSADIGIIAGGRYGEASARDTEIGGYPVMVPMIDIHTIGAGGGSIAYLDAGGSFRVGPQSAGARPGPAAYGHGGQAPTVTDAHSVLGRLQAGNFLGGEMDLDLAAAEAVMDGLATELSLSREEAAEGVLTIVNANMANAIRARTVEKGLDPRDFALLAFGGAGPLHAVDVARELGIPEVIVPPYPGITSAVGLLTTDLKYDAVRTEFQTSEALDLERLTRDFEEMQTALAAEFAKSGLSADRVAYERSGDLRFAGQGYELRVPFAEGPITEESLARTFGTFEALHRSEYGYEFPDGVIQIVNIRVSGVGRMPKIGLGRVEGGGSLAEALLDRRESHFRTNGVLRKAETPLYARQKLPLGVAIPGPAIIVQKDTTTVIPPGATAKAEGSGNILIDTGG